MTTQNAPETPMDMTFIERNQIVERYLAGKLPPKGASDFERFCRAHPELLVKLGLPDRIHAGLKLMESAGQPEPWAEKKPAFYHKPILLIVATAVAIAALAAASVLSMGAGKRDQKITQLQKLVDTQPLSATQSTRVILTEPGRNGPSSQTTLAIGGKGAELADFKLDLTKSKYTTFRVTIDRVDQGRVLVLGNQLRDSNGHLRLSLNSSALGPGNYTMTIEGLDWRGSPNPDAWLNFAVVR